MGECILESYNKQYEILKQEMRDLKNCQMTFINLSVTSTGLLFGLIIKLEIRNPLVFLIPLSIVIPSWWIFFDKAATVTRAVGLCIGLEKIISDNNKQKHYFIGIENALEKFRIKQSDIKSNGYNYSKIQKIKLIFSIAFLKDNMQKMKSLLNIALLGNNGDFTFQQKMHLFFQNLWDKSAIEIVISIVFIIILLSVIWNAWMVWQLTLGKYSYSTNQKIWNELLFFEAKS